MKKNGFNDATRACDTGVLESFQASKKKCNTKVCPPVRGDNPRAVASGLSLTKVDNHSIHLLYQISHTAR